MIGLWIAAALVSAGAAALVVQRAARGARRNPGSELDLAVYRRQMADIDALADRGLLAEGERRSIRAETGRRLLAAAHRGEAPFRAASPALVLALAAGLPLLAAAAYAFIGAPGYADMPFAKRLDAWRHADPSDLTPPQMAAILRAIAAERPTDPAPLQNLAAAELASGQPMEAVQALQRALTLAPARADLWDGLGEAQAEAANGDVSEDSQASFRRALALAPNDPEARYALARARISAGDTAGGLADWRALDASLAPADPRRAALESEIAEVVRTGVLPADTAAADSSGDAVGAPQIQAMVDGLAAQLKANPDNPRGWVQLVRALTVLGETDRRDAALVQARRRYAGRADILGALDAASRPPVS
ncbi:MAG TPA: c-type cytochrome biogenesis protein CcmI [Caulobacteraceae bacterium]|nr:c-type cytochrome biogenesis protein CcmI [Caulobacteraceae bacterium]